MVTTDKPFYNSTSVIHCRITVAQITLKQQRALQTKCLTNNFATSQVCLIKSLDDLKTSGESDSEFGLRGFGAEFATISFSDGTQPLFAHGV